MPAKGQRAPLLDRFLSKTRRAENGCLIWTAGRVRYGYGGFMYEGRLVSAHRFAYELVNSPIPDGMMVLHSCDNPPCVEPDHLRVGTHADNMRDMTERGRQSDGASKSELQRAVWARLSPAERTARALRGLATKRRRGV